MIDQEQIRKLSPADGDIFLLPADSPYDLVRQLGEAITLAKPGVKAIVMCGDMRKLDVAAMNAAGWYRA
ncbi:hypothetical protein ACIQU2_09275 [Pseudomonas sp. NPDC098740]|uniref:hypothetical protein n=1 Tax=Pseudomonas sp. NPDC098740 TaxID=3364486 RepID=UPI00383B44D4